MKYTRKHPRLHSGKTKKKHIKSNNYDNTYIISHGTNPLGLNFNILANILNSYGLRKTTNPESKPTFLALFQLDNGRYNKSYYNTQAMIFNLLNDSKTIITDKYNLYKAFQKQFPGKCSRYMAKSWDLKTFLDNPSLMKQITNHGKIMIVKPVGIGAMAGQGITIVSDKESMDLARRRVAKYKNAMISEYLVNPYLFEGKKFHIRAYYMVLVGEEYNNGNRTKMVQTKLFPFGKILTAKDKYINGDWGNADIHDTHFESTGRDIYFPDDLPTAEERRIFTREIFPEMGRCLQFISKIISPVIQKYDTCQYGFEIFGCDFMVVHKPDSSLQVKLLEINDKVGFLNAAPNKALQLSKLFFNEIKTGILDPILVDKPTVFAHSLRA